jgi:hypothetical protein
MHVLCFGFGSLVLIAFGATALLRQAILLVNRIEAPEPAGGIAEWDWDEWDDEYAAPRPPRRRAGPIPVPGLGRCLAFAYAAVVTFAVGSLLTGVVAVELLGVDGDDVAYLAVAVVNLPVTGLTLAALLTVLLPTTFGRAVRIVFVYGFLLLALGLFIGLVGVLFAACLV